MARSACCRDRSGTPSSVLLGQCQKGSLKCKFVLTLTHALVLRSAPAVCSRPLASTLKSCNPSLLPWPVHVYESNNGLLVSKLHAVFGGYYAGRCPHGVVSATHYDSRR